MKKNVLLGSLLVLVLLWTMTGHSPLQLLVTFIAAGALPGIDVSLSPYVMVGLAVVAAVMMFIKITKQDFFAQKVEDTARSKTRVKLTAQQLGFFEYYHILAIHYSDVAKQKIVQSSYFKSYVEKHDKLRKVLAQRIATLRGSQIR